METGISVGPEWELIEDLDEGFDFVELAVGEKEIKLEDIDFEEFGAVLEEKGFELVLHLPFRQPLATQVPELNSAVIEYFERLLVETKVDVEKAVVHSDIRAFDEEGFEEFENQVEILSRIGQKHGTEIVFENVGFFTEPDLFTLGDILRKNDASMCLDTGHAFTEVGQEEMEEFANEYSDIISHLHLQDTREGKDLHMPLGSAEIDFETFFEALGRFDGTACMEIFTDDPDYQELSRKKLEEYSS